MSYDERYMIKTMRKVRYVTAILTGSIHSPVNCVHVASTGMRACLTRRHVSKQAVYALVCQGRSFRIYMWPL